MNEFLEGNRALWDEWTGVHESSEFYRVEAFRAGGIRLRDYELEQVGDVQGKSLPPAVPFRDRHIVVGAPRRHRHGCGLLTEGDRPGQAPGRRSRPRCAVRRVERLRSPGSVGGVIRRGVHVARRAVLAPRHPRLGARGGTLREARGILFITEAHPIAWALDEDLPLTFRYPYSEHAEPLVFDVEGSYADRNADVKTEKEHGWNRGLGEIVTALVDAGMTIELLREYPFSEWEMGFTVEGPDDTWVPPDSVEGELPLFYSLRARKPL